MQSGGFLQGCEWAWQGCVGVYEQPGWLSKSATGKKEKRAGCSEAWVCSFRGHWCLFLWMEFDEEVQGKHSNSNWKQTGASGTMPLHSASLSCLYAAAREGGFGRHGAESKPWDEYVLTLLQRETHDQNEFAVIEFSVLPVKECDWPLWLVVGQKAEEESPVSIS